MIVIMIIIHSFGNAEDITMIIIIRIIILIIFMMFIIIVIAFIIVIMILSSIYKDEGCDNNYHRSILCIANGA